MREYIYCSHARPTDMMVSNFYQKIHRGNGLLPDCSPPPAAGACAGLARAPTTALLAAAAAAHCWWSRLRRPAAVLPATPAQRHGWPSQTWRPWEPTAWWPPLRPSSSWTRRSYSYFSFPSYTCWIFLLEVIRSQLPNHTTWTAVGCYKHQSTWGHPVLIRETEALPALSMSSLPWKFHGFTLIDLTNSQKQRNAT